MTNTREEKTMQMWADVQLELAETRRQELESQAEAVRLATAGTRGRTSTGLRAGVGRALIRAGHALAPEPVVMHHHRRRVAARQP
jgi:hypothetical protein